MSDKWLDWARRLQSLAQAGLTFSKDVYDIERYEELRNISLEIMNERTGMQLHKIRDLFANETGYPTPKADVRGVVFQDHKILMVMEKMDERWSLPGGFCEIGVSPAENVVKEIREESGFETVPVKLLALLDKNKHPHPPEAHHYYKIFIRCEIVGGTPTSGIETQDIKFFPEDALPALSTNRNTESQIKLMFEFLKKPSKETVFD